MQRTFFTTLAALAACTSLNAATVAQEASRPPNIIVLLSDDLGYADVGFHGVKDIATPNLDSLAAGGTRFTNAYVSGPYCSPTRAGFITGQYQNRFGHEFNPTGQQGLPRSETTIADRLKEAGYHTGLIGKWHLGAQPNRQPLQRGFDEFFGFLGGANPYFVAESENIYRGESPVTETEYLTDAFGREAADFIKRNEQKPFFLYLAFNAVHTPLQAPDDRLAKFASIKDKQRQTYAAMLTALDDAVGRVLDSLRQHNLEENTLVFFFNDNGGPTMPTTTINGADNTPLRGSKRTTLEGGVRVPFVVQWKGKLPGGKVYDKPVIQLDILPTALAAAGVQTKPEWKLDGVNLLPYLQGEQEGTPHEALYWRLGPQRAIRKGDWKLVQYDVKVDLSPEQARQLPRNAWPEVTETRLYNLADDIGETQDLAQKHPEKLAELEAQWKTWAKELAEPRWGPTPQGPQPAAANSR